ncbi:MAG: AraC family transcriptional regulator [Anaerocolumna sp.]
MPFYLTTENFPKSSFMQRKIYPEDWMHFPRTPNEYILFIINDGTLYMREDDIKYELQTGDMLLLEPGHFHVGYKCSYVDYYFIHMPLDTFEYIRLETGSELMNYFQQNKRNYFKSNPLDYELYDSCKPLIPKTIHIDTVSLQHIRREMDEVIKALASRDEYYKLICTKNILDILVCLSRCYSNLVYSEGSNPETVSKMDIRVEAILTYLQRNYQTKLTGKDLENHLHMNFDYLNRIFKSQIGMTIFEYLKVFRLNKSKELLNNSNMKLYEIAALTGFPNEYHFNRVFTNMVGITPGKYRHTT